MQQSDMIERIERLVQTTPPEVVAKLGTLQKERERDSCNPLMLHKGLKQISRDSGSLDSFTGGWDPGNNYDYVGGASVYAYGRD